MAFSFGTPQTTQNFTLTTATPSVGDAKPTTNLLGTPTAKTFSFGATTPSTPGFSLGAGTAAPTTGFSLGTGTATPNATTTGFSLGTGTATPTGFSLGTGTATTTTTGFSLGTGTATSTTGFPLGSAATTTAKVAPTFSFTSPATSTAATTAPTLNFASPVVSTAATTAPTLNFNLGSSVSAASTTAPALNLSFGTTPAATTSAGLATTSSTTPLKLTTSVPTTDAAVASAAATTAPSLSTSLISTQTASAVTTSTTSTLATAQPAALTYSQLEDFINKWTMDLEEQSKFFINQAKQLNAWDNLLISNSNKIRTLNETIERVKLQQKQLDQELDFVLAQQNELDELSLPLEKQLSDVPITDQNRFQMYQLSEVIDSQLKQMSEDLKEIVEHLNDSNKDDDLSDPVAQVSHILNAHMNSLQWVDRNTTQISSHLEQISKLQDVYKKDNFNL